MLSCGRLGILSNLLFFRGGPAIDESAPCELRLARPEELATVVRLIVTSPNGQFEEAHAREFLRLADSHRGDAGGAWIAYQGAVPLGGALAVASPGKTMLVFTPSYLPTATHKRLTVGAIEGLCEGAIAAGIHLAQSLIDPDDKSLQALFEQCGFSPLAELHYLQSSGSKRAKEATLPPGLRWVTYSEERHELFAQAIVATYQNSLDCPGLNGLRDVRDVIEGHRATGEFDPSLWFVLLNGETPLGVLLLSRVQRGEMMELVYLGLTPTARGQGLGDLLMRQALSMTVAHRQARMSLAVDAANVPALRLYWRHGLQVIGRKRAMLRDLRRPIVHANISEVHADSA